MHKRLALMLLLIISVVFTQGMRAHMHAYDHGHADQAGHVEQAHSAYSLHDLGHDAHAGQPAEIGFSSDGMLAKLFLDLPILALVLAILIVLSRLSGQPVPPWSRLTPLRRSTNVSSPPPLRAPPR